MINLIINQLKFHQIEGENLSNAKIIKKVYINDLNSITGKIAGQFKSKMKN